MPSPLSGLPSSPGNGAADDTAGIPVAGRSAATSHPACAAPHRRAGRSSRARLLASVLMAALIALPPAAPAQAQGAARIAAGTDAPPPRPDDIAVPDEAAPDGPAPGESAPDDAASDDAPDADASSDITSDAGDAADADGSAVPAGAPEDTADGLAGAYLAARQAADSSDFVNAAKWFTAALDKDPHDPFLIDSTLLSLISAGQTGDAATLSHELARRGDATELAGLVLRAAAARAGDWKALQGLLDGGEPDRGGSSENDLLDGMLRAWAELGLGRASETMAQMQKLARIRGARAMVDYDLALVKASVGDYEGAETLLARRGVGEHLLGTIARVEVLAQLDRRDEALTLIADSPGAAEEPALTDLAARLKDGRPVPFTALQGATDGVAQTFLTFASALAAADEPDPLALVQARLAEWLRPDLADARLIAAQLLQSVGQFDLAEQEYAALGRLGEVRPVAELARVSALAHAGRLEDSERAARALTEARPELPASWFALGDIMRQREEYADAVPAYSRGLELMEKAGDADADSRWFPLYARGIARERSGDIKGAEADMRAALKIRPDQAPILNYLGYTFIDRGINLDEGLAMVEKAAELQPDDGYIQDSLGWGLYRVGRYREAVAPMEKAATQMSSDPLVNDHLGDVYWKVGRKREAEVQWRRALSLVLDENVHETDEEVDPDRLREKIEFGLTPPPGDAGRKGDGGNVAPPDGGAASAPPEAGAEGQGQGETGPDGAGRDDAGGK